MLSNKLSTSMLNKHIKMYNEPRGLVNSTVRVAKTVMTEAIELHDSDVAAVEIVEGAVHIEFSKAYIWAEDKGWGQKASLILENAQVNETPNKLPATISEGMLSGEQGQFDNIVPLPFSEHGTYSVELAFTSGERLKITGQNPRVELIGERRFIEEAGQL